MKWSIYLIWYGDPDVFKFYRPTFLIFNHYILDDKGHIDNNSASYKDPFNNEIIVSRDEIDKKYFIEI